MAEGRTSITQEFLSTDHNPTYLKKLSTLEVPPEEMGNDEELDKIVATSESLGNSLGSAEKPPQDSNGSKANGKETEPVGSGGGCCVIL